MVMYKLVAASVGCLLPASLSESNMNPSSGLPQFVVMSDVDQGVHWEPEPFIDRTILVPEDLAGAAGQMLMVESSQFGGYDTHTRATEMQEGDAWSPVEVPHAVMLATRIAVAKAAAAAAEAEALRLSQVRRLKAAGGQAARP